VVWQGSLIAASNLRCQLPAGAEHVWLRADLQSHAIDPEEPSVMQRSVVLALESGAEVPQEAIALARLCKVDCSRRIDATWFPEVLTIGADPRSAKQAESLRDLMQELAIDPPRSLRGSDGAWDTVLDWIGIRLRQWATDNPARVERIDAALRLTSTPAAVQQLVESLLCWTSATLPNRIKRPNATTLVLNRDLSRRPARVDNLGNQTTSTFNFEGLTPGGELVLMSPNLANYVLERGSLRLEGRLSPNKPVVIGLAPELAFTLHVTGTETVLAGTYRHGSSAA
jgi:hypothetical protein